MALLIVSYFLKEVFELFGLIMSFLTTLELFQEVESLFTSIYAPFNTVACVITCEALPFMSFGSQYESHYGNKCLKPTVYELYTRYLQSFTVSVSC